LLERTTRRYFEKLLNLNITDFSKLDPEVAQQLADPDMKREELRELMRSNRVPGGWFYVERAAVIMFGLQAQLAPKLNGIPSRLPVRHAVHDGAQTRSESRTPPRSRSWKKPARETRSRRCGRCNGRRSPAQLNLDRAAYDPVDAYGIFVASPDPDRNVNRQDREGRKTANDRSNPISAALAILALSILVQMRARGAPTLYRARLSCPRRQAEMVGSMPEDRGDADVALIDSRLRC